MKLSGGRIVVVLVEQASRLLGGGKIDAAAVPEIVRAVLRAMGCAPDDAAQRADEAAHNTPLHNRHPS
ncbi:hypothetical protein [Ensifer sp. ENS11]|uniref:hypothetical protein n=1 Tax=Ensifer sp. ENS11 TaxID=2769291 RepID=UPI00177BD6C3|nr:hypothetical protein [Ensifer sp. ENS11]MBD9491532.1 hypothetical protein [Ensifer sp. ENS11]MDP9635047.1 hypothetical protein [Ensifer adhaerens]